MADLAEKIKTYKEQGKSLLETYEQLRRDGLTIPWLEVKAMYLRAMKG